MSDNKNVEVIMSVYYGTDVDFLIAAVNSTLKAIEHSANMSNGISLTIGVDGPVGRGVETALIELAKRPQINLTFFDENRGLGLVLSDLIAASNADIIVRMDDDDIMCEERITMCLQQHFEKGYDIVCGNILEFRDGYPDELRIRRPKSSLNFFSSYFRNPINHVAVSFKRSLAIQAGNYRDVLLFEDWDLWLRMRKRSSSFKAVDKIFVRVRFDNSVVNRRRGFSYIKRELFFAYNIARNRDIGFVLFLIVLPFRASLRLMPAKVLNQVMATFLRH